MSRPGVEVTLLDQGGSVSLPTDTGVAFVVGLTDRGPANSPTILGGLNELVAIFGDRQTYSSIYDWFDMFFREGGYQAYLSRVVGPAATVGTHNLLDAGAGISLVVSAAGPGAWSANYKVAVVAGGSPGSVAIQVLDSANVLLEQSNDLFTQNDAVLWSAGSNYVRVALGATALMPAVAAAAALTAGDDDRASAGDAQRLTALNSFPADLGPGQIVAPGVTTDTGHQQLRDHAGANNRRAVLDLVDTATQATLTAAAAAVWSRWVGAFAPWILAPGVVAGTVRKIPPSALVCGLMARNDNAYGPDTPSAGNRGISRFGTGVTQTWDNTTRQSLNGAGVNVIRDMFDTVRIYGWRSTTSPTGDANWIDFGNSRLFMSLSAEFDNVGENFEFRVIDGQHGQTIGAFHDALAGVCMAHFLRGELFGSTPEEAFLVDTGPTVNTINTIQNHELHAIVSVKMSPFAEWVQIYVVKKQLTEVI